MFKPEHLKTEIQVHNNW